MPLRVLLVDDNHTFLVAAAGLLEAEGLNVVGRASSGAEAIAAVGRLQPDVAIVDIKLDGESGFDVARAIAGGHVSRPPRVILVSTQAEEDFVDFIHSSPAAGFVPKGDLSAQSIRDTLAAGRG
jgi:DNA-binding NarL/FixJ family response regulator